MKWWRVALAGAAVIATVGLGSSSTASAQSGAERIRAYTVDVTIQSDGSILVHETIDYDFGAVSRHGIYRSIPVRFDYPPKADTDRVYPIHVVSVTASGGASSRYTTEDFTESGIGYERIKIGDPDRTITGAHT